MRAQSLCESSHVRDQDETEPVVPRWARRHLLDQVVKGVPVATKCLVQVVNRDDNTRRQQLSVTVGDQVVPSAPT
jgi:hypothetical protein